MMWMKICFYEYIPGKKRNANHGFSIPAFASDRDLGQKNLNLFALQSVIDHVFESAFGMQNVP
jgi:hypothetical protein